MDSTTLVPAYGRDYKSKKDVLADWNGNKDFLIAYNGRLINKQQFQPGQRVGIRYAKLRKMIYVQA